MTYTAGTADADHSITLTKGNVQRFEVREGERITSDAFSDTPDKERSELGAFDNPAPYLTDVWVSYAFRITADELTSDWLIAGQFRATDDAADIQTRSPVLSINLYSADIMQIRTIADAADPSTAPVASVLRYSGSFTRGTWHRVVMRVQFAKTGNGELQAWLDGSEVIATTAIPVGYNDAVGPYWRYGIYRETDPAEVVIEYANMEYGTTSLLARVATPLPI